MPLVPNRFGTESGGRAGRRREVGQWAAAPGVGDRRRVGLVAAPAKERRRVVVDRGRDRVRDGGDVGVVAQAEDLAWHERFLPRVVEQLGKELRLAIRRH